MSRRRFFIALVLLLLCIAGVSAYPEYAPYGEKVSYFYGSLSREEKELYDLIYDGVLDYRETIEFPHGFDMDMVNKVITILDDEAPELFWLGHTWSTTYYNSNPNVAVGVTMKYTMSEQEAIRRWKSIMKFSKSIETTGTNDLIDELTLLETLMKHVTYVEGERAHNASGAIVDGKAVCEGYAKAATLLLRLHGIPSGVIGGTSVLDGKRDGHAWNIVRIGGEWTLFDLTWIDHEEASFYDWLNLSDEMFADSHIPDDVPRSYYNSTDTYEIARILELYCYGNVKEHFFRELEQLIESDIPVLIYFEDERLYDQMLKNHDAWIREYNDIHGKDGFYGKYSFSWNDRRRRFYLDWS